MNVIRRAPGHSGGPLLSGLAAGVNKNLSYWADKVCFTGTKGGAQGMPGVAGDACTWQKQSVRDV